MNQSGYQSVWIPRHKSRVKKDSPFLHSQPCDIGSTTLSLWSGRIQRGGEEGWDKKVRSQWEKGFRQERGSAGKEKSGWKVDRRGVDQVESWQQVVLHMGNVSFVDLMPWWRCVEEPGQSLYGFHIWSDDVALCAKPKAYSGGWEPSYALPTHTRATSKGAWVAFMDSSASLLLPWHSPHPHTSTSIHTHPHRLPLNTQPDLTCV